MLRCTLLMLITTAGVLAVVPSANAYRLRQTPDGQQIRWRRANVVMRVDPTLESALGVEAARSAAVMAAEAWRGLPGVPDIVIEQGAPPPYQAGRPSNGIYLLSDWPFRRGQLAITVSSYAPSGELMAADVLINGTHTFALLTEGDPGGGRHHNDIGAVLAHELGHVLGLDESPEHESATMYPFIRAGDVHQRTLEHDDEEGAIAVYQHELPAPTCSAGQRSGAAGPWAFVLLASLAALRSRRRRDINEVESTARLRSSS